MPLTNREETLIAAWVRKLSTIRTNRKDLQQKLLSALQDKNTGNPIFRLEHFNRLRNALLSENHDQGVFWTASFNWFWDIVTRLSFGLIKRAGNGSRLRKALVEEPRIQTESVNIETLNRIEKKLISLTDSQFQHAPVDDIVRDIRSRLAQHSVNPEEIDIMLRRISMVKKYVNPDNNGISPLAPQMYKLLLDEVFEQYPAHSLHHFFDYYDHHLHHDTLKLNQYLIIDKIGDELVKHFIDTQPTVHQRLHNGINLLLLLSIHRPEVSANYRTSNQQQGFIGFLEMLAYYNMTHVSLNDNSCTQIIHHLRDQLHKEESLTEQAQNKSKEILSFSCTDDNYMALLKNFFEKYRFKTSDNPLLILFARKFCERLFADYFSWQNSLVEKSETELSDKESLLWQDNGLANQLIQFVSEKILDQKNQYFLMGENKKEEELSNQIKLMRNTSYSSNIPIEMRLVEQFYMQLSLNYAAYRNPGQLCLAARQIRSTVQHFSPDQQYWLSNRLAKIVPEPVMKKVNYILTELEFYDENDIPQTKPQDITTADDLIVKIKTHLHRAEKAFALLNAAVENQAIYDALIAFRQCLSLPDLTPDNLCGLLDILNTRLHDHSITHALSSTFHNLIEIEQYKLIRKIEVSPGKSRYTFLAETNKPPSEGNLNLERSNIQLQG